ncbi:MAG: transposase, partial [Patescibacteria group bacterium]
MDVHRRSIRLPAFDYSTPGAYFVTICTYERRCMFGDVVDGEMRLNEVGKSVSSNIRASESIRREIRLDEWIIMPNHLHLIVWFGESDDGLPDPVAGA